MKRIDNNFNSINNNGNSEVTKHPIVGLYCKQQRFYVFLIVVGIATGLIGVFYLTMFFLFPVYFWEATVMSVVLFAGYVLWGLFSLTPKKLDLSKHFVIYAKWGLGILAVLLISTAMFIIFAENGIIDFRGWFK